jgi:predicted dehydrogenase
VQSNLAPLVDSADPAAAPLRWAIVGPGRIAHRFAQAVCGLPEAQLVALCARNPQQAQAFADQWAPANGAALQLHSSLADLLANPAVDAVYVATPHSLHAGAVAACLQAGKPVLCEKPLVPSRAIALPLVALAQQHRVFLMEAMWSRFLPVYAHVARWLQDAEGGIGPVRAVQSSFCFNAPFDATSRLFDPDLAGGALLDIGIYNLSLTRWVLQQAWGACPEPLAVHVHGVLAPTGVDQRVAATLQWPGGVTAQLVCGLDLQADNSLRIFGERGAIEVPGGTTAGFWQATSARLQRQWQNPAEALVVHAPFAINGFEGQIVEATRCIRAGLIESPVMPHAETLATLGWIDQLRARLGVRYPFEA